MRRSLILLACFSCSLRALALTRVFNVTDRLIAAEPPPDWSTSAIRPDSVVLSTTGEGSAVSFSFKGQSIEIAGTSSGAFSVIVDDERELEFQESGSPGSPLFRIVGLEPQRVHTLVVMKTSGRGTLSLESIKIVTASSTDVQPALVDPETAPVASTESSQATAASASPARSSRSDSVLRTAPSGFATSVKASSVASIDPTSYASGTFVNPVPVPTTNPLDFTPTDRDMKNGSDASVRYAGAIVGTLVGLALIVIGFFSCRRYRANKNSFAHQLYVPPKTTTPETRSMRNLWFVNSSVDSTQGTKATSDSVDRLPDTRRFYKLSSNGEDLAAPRTTAETPSSNVEPVVLASRPSPAPFSSFQFPQPRLPSELVTQQQHHQHQPTRTTSKRTRFASKPPSLIFVPNTPRTMRSSSSLPSISEIVSPVETPTFGGATSEREASLNENDAVATTVPAGTSKRLDQQQDETVKTNFFQSEYIGQRGSRGPKYSPDKGDPRLSTSPPRQARARQTM
ncbi:hypothetical protein ACM66B_005187 [Microbotryomycetes sp. NB124-2]